MKKLISILILSVMLFSATLFTGCSTIDQSQRSLAGPTYIIDNNIDVIEQLFLDKAKVMETNYYSEKDENVKILIREQIVFGAMNVIDLRYRVFYSSQYVRGASINTVADITSGSLSTAGALATNGGSQILSGLSALVIASNSSYSKNFLAEKGIDVILDRMEANRIEVKANIIKNLKEPTTIYPLGQAMLDVQDYAMAGTLPQAIMALKKDTSKSIISANELKLQSENLKRTK